MGAKKVVDAKVGSLKVPLTCIGEICFTEDGGILVKIPKDADPECARRTAETILGRKPVKFEIEGREEK